MEQKPAALKPVPYRESIRLVEKFGIETPVQAVVSKREEADAATDGHVPFPLVLKAIPSDAAHKTEQHLVVTGLRTKAEAMQAFDDLVMRTTKMSIDCYVFQQQVDGVEFIVGGKRDGVFGQTVIFGMGGVYVELTEDFSVRVCPLDFDTAYDMINETKARAFFSKNGFRGRKASRTKVAELLIAAAKLLEEYPLVCLMDINPVIATPDKCLAADVRMFVNEV
jgi:succinyl-CoA synthetase beta subunit